MAPPPLQYGARMKARLLPIVLLALPFASLSACRGGGALNDDPYRQGMVEAAIDDGPKITRTPGADFTKYARVVVEPVALDPDATQGDEVSDEQLGKLRGQFATDLRASFAKRFAVSSSAAAGSDPVLAVRATIVRAVPNKPMRNVLPQTQLTRTGFGYAAVRVQLCDAATGAELAAFTETRSTKRFGLEKLSEWGSVEKSFEVWAQQALDIAK